MKVKVVVADDSPLILDVVRELLEARGAEVHTIASAIGLSGLLRRVNPDAVVLDFNMPAIRGDEAIQTVRRVCPSARVVLFSDDPRARDYAVAHGVPFVNKRATGDQLVDAVLA